MQLGKRCLGEKSSLLLPSRLPPWVISRSFYKSKETTTMSRPTSASSNSPLTVSDPIILPLNPQLHPGMNDSHDDYELRPRIPPLRLGDVTETKDEVAIPMPSIPPLSVRQCLNAESKNALERELHCWENKYRENADFQKKIANHA